jgi:hypothetical protein
MPNPTDDRQRHRLIAAECSALVDLLDELNPPTSYPALNATDREIGAWLGRRKLVEELKLLRLETIEGRSGSLPRVIGG